MWKECIKGYEISSSQAIVRNSITKKVIKEERNGRGYRRITIKNKHYILHRLFAITFIPNPDNLPDVIFKDTDKENIRMDNLQWSAKHKCATLLYINPKDLRGNVKLTEGMIRVIKSNKRMTNKQLAHMYKISLSTIYAVNKGKNMKRFIDYTIFV